ncbi:MAG: ABC transporter ATP-binding protein [Minisyncoccia bacterium]|jgi:lipopolysaccharide transport system ATP-binding protein
MIKAKGIAKLYRIPHEKTTTLFELVLGYIKDQVTYENFYALKNVNFSIDKGEMVGLVGKNGSGKTTLLKILGGIVPPTEGEFQIEGTVAPLLSLSVGFHHELTAQENLYLYGAILGMPRKEIKDKLDRIFDFAGVGKFRDMKVKNFSSGMIARLAFATMVQTDPDVLLLDEIFAVGDKDFKPQCFSVFEDYKRRGKTIIFASHDLTAVAEHCERTLLLDKGELKAFGKTKDVLDQYGGL